jgi:hypothetical protein
LWLDLVLFGLFYVVPAVSLLAGTYLYLEFSGASHYGIGREYEAEGNYSEAARHYALAARYCGTRRERAAAEDALRAVLDRHRSP